MKPKKKQNKFTSARAMSNHFGITQSNHLTFSYISNVCRVMVDGIE